MGSAKQGEAEFPSGFNQDLRKTSRASADQQGEVSLKSGAFLKVGSEFQELAGAVFTSAWRSILRFCSSACTESQPRCQKLTHVTCVTIVTIVRRSSCCPRVWLLIVSEYGSAVGYSF